MKAPRKVPKTLTVDQVQQILAHCRHRRDRFLVALLYETGMRIGQALNLRHADYLVHELDGIDSDYVFVNLWGGARPTAHVSGRLRSVCPPESRAHQLQVLMDWLNTSAICTTSLVEQDVAKHLVSFRTYLTTKGIAQKLVEKRLDGSQTVRVYHKDDPTLSILRQLYRILEDAYDGREEYEKSVWNVKKLGVSVNGSRSDYTLNFTHLAPEWLQTAGKCFIRYSLATNSVPECQNRLMALTWFGRFLRSRTQPIAPQEIDRPLILEYLGYLQGSSLFHDSRKKRLIGLRTFLEVAARKDGLPCLHSA
ncbi:tyrosine-type recombinase/integrase [Sulfobacillus sp. hq2]|uniref:tyrosine-type recombinase/integrase n=1 Tax=Sulfobacillus TaxID=28033 RepID=UPI0021015438|nr:tyrosine-type recombinase/integrase [Sulfobacillus sp. hq2]